MKLALKCLLDEAQLAVATVTGCGEAGFKCFLKEEGTWGTGSDKDNGDSKQNSGGKKGARAGRKLRSREGRRSGCHAGIRMEGRGKDQGSQKNQEKKGGRERRDGLTHISAPWLLGLGVILTLRSQHTVNSYRQSCTCFLEDRRGPKFRVSSSTHRSFKPARASHCVWVQQVWASLPDSYSCWSADWRDRFRWLSTPGPFPQQQHTQHASSSSTSDGDRPGSNVVETARRGKGSGWQEVGRHSLETPKRWRHLCIHTHNRGALFGACGGRISCVCANVWVCM